MTSYPHTLAICVPDAMADDANALALVTGEQPTDAQAYVDPNCGIPTDAAAPGEDAYLPAHFKVALVTPALVAALTGDEPLQAPSFAPDADLEAAERARAALSFSGAATSGVISVRIDMDGNAAWTEFGLVDIDLPPAAAAPPFTRSDQLEALAELRWLRETGGLSFSGGKQIKTTRESQAQINAVLTSLSLGMVQEPIAYKLDSGWEDLTAAEIAGVAALVAQHVMACFEAERDVTTALEGMDAYWTADLGALFDTAYAGHMGA